MNKFAPEKQNSEHEGSIFGNGLSKKILPCPYKMLLVAAIWALLTVIHKTAKNRWYLGCHKG